ncbi:MAG: CARDB domain-containing protein [Terracidiphilus sp.]
MKNSRSFVRGFAAKVLASLAIVFFAAVSLGTSYAAGQARPANSPNLTPLVTLKSDSTTLGAKVANWTEAGLNSASGAAGLSFIPVAVGAFGTYTNVPPGAPAGTVVVNIAPVPTSGDANGGYFKATFNVPAGVTAVSLTGAANVDDTGRVFLNGNPLTQAMECSGSNCVTESGNATFSTTNLAYFKVGGANTILISDANTHGGPSGTAFWIQVSVQVGGNLIVTAVGNPPATVNVGGIFTASDTTQNNGTAAIAASVTRFYLSPTTAKTSSSILLGGSRQVPGLNAGASSSGTATVSVPGGISPGVYYLLACADDTQSVPEASATPNCKASSSTTTVSGPNLVETAISNPQPFVNIADHLQVTDTVKNTGNASAAASVTRYYLSPTTAVTSASFAMGGSRAVPSLAAGQSSSGSATPTVPAGMAHGAYYLIACADALMEVPETSPTPNCKASATTVTVSGADLVETAVSNPPYTFKTGGSFSVTDTAKNIGPIPAQASTTRFYLSTTTAKNGSSYPLTGTRSVGSLAPNATSSGTTQVTVPTGVAPASYYLLACANDTGSAPESDPTNNCRASAGQTNNQALALPPSGPLATATQGKSYSGGVNATGMGPNYKWTLVSGAGNTPIPISGAHIALANGLYVFNTGGFTLSIGGTPTTTSTVNFSVSVTDTATNTTVGPMQYSITVNPLMTLQQNTTLPSGTVGVSYIGAVLVSGGGPAYTWNLKIGSTTVGVPTNGAAVGIADGITASNDGSGKLTLGGKPTTAQTVSFGVQVKDTATGIVAGPVTYTIQVNSSLSLPNGNPPSLGPATVGQKYTGSISASGGTSGTYGWWVNGLGISQAGLSVTLGDGLSATTTNNNVLTITGTPTSATTVNFNVTVTNNGNTAGPNNYSIQVNGQQGGSTVGGNIWLTSGCGNGNLGGIKVTLSPGSFAPVYTDQNGNFQFPNVPNGSYTLTPSVGGAASLFTPATQPVTVNNGPVNVNFQAQIGYTVTGSVSYSGKQTGRVYVELENQNCGGGGSSYGTSISAAGAFAIHGVPPGTYKLVGWMDNVGFGQPNDANPSGNTTNVQVPNTAANPVGPTVALNDPGAITLTSAPQVQGGSPFANEVFLGYKPLMDNNGVEMATSYTVQWAISSTGFSAPAGSTTFAADGDQNDIWVVNKANVTGLISGGTYWFRARGVAGSTPGPWSQPVGPYQLVSQPGANTVTGQVSFKGTATGPLYVGFYNPNGGIAVTQVGSKSAPPVSPASFTVNVPNGTYYLFGIVDQNNDGLIDAGDIQNTGGQNMPAVTFPGSSLTQNLTLPSGNASTAVSTQHSHSVNQYGTSDSYALKFDVRSLVKLPVALQIATGPKIVAPIDVGECMDCGHPFSFWISTGNVALAVGDSYGLAVTYSDGTSEVIPAQVGTVLNAFTTNMKPQGTGASSRPNFSWTDPANASSYVYQFQLWDQNYNTIWQIPSNNSKSNGFTNSITSLTWGVDPTGGGNTPSESTLPNGIYNWQIQADDANGNQATSQVYFQVGTGGSGLSLPQGNPTSLPGTATVGQTYSGAVNAGGGSMPYSFTVNGISIPTNNNKTLITNGIYANNSGGNTLSFSGTPMTAGTVTLNVTVNDGAHDTPASATYTIAVSNASALGLPPSSSVPALVGVPFSQSLNASGGPGGGNYVFTVNGTTVPTNNTPLTIPNGDGLTATNSGGNTLFFGGTPTAAETVTLNVSVSDTLKETAGPVAYTVNVVNGPSGANNGKLNGTYACLTEGFNDSDGSRWASVSSFQADGAGHLKNGVWDENSRYSSSVASGTVTGSYAIGQDNNGLATTTSVVTQGGSGTMSMKWAIALTDAVSPAQQFRMVEVDDIGTSPSGQHGTANCYLANTSAFAASTLGGYGFVFSLHGEGSGGNPKAGVGRFNLGVIPGGASTGAMTAGIIDMAKGGNSSVETTQFTGTYTAPNSATGRYTLTLNAGGDSLSLVGYIIDANRGFLFVDSPGTSDGVQAGNVRKQQQTSYTGSNIKGPFAIYAQGMEFNGSSNTPSGYYTEVMQGAGDGAGNITINASYKDESGTYKSGAENGGPIALTFDPSNPGRVTLTPGNNTAYLYLFNTNNALEMSGGGSGAVESGWLEPQVQPSTLPFTDSYIAGTYLFGQMPQVDPGANGNVGEFAVNASGNITGAITTAGEGDFTWDNPMSMTYAWDSSTYGSYLLTGGGQKNGVSCIVINATKSVCIIDTDTSATPLILQQ